jgi:hypothetical protein
VLLLYSAAKSDPDMDFYFNGAPDPDPNLIFIVVLMRKQ